MSDQTTSPLASLEEISGLDPLPPPISDQSLRRRRQQDSGAALEKYTTSPGTLQPVDAASIGRAGAIDRSKEAGSARYVTVSAILSRSGALLPVQTGSHAQEDIFAPSRMSNDGAIDARRRRSGTISSGNALEALGALLLHKDSKGRASNLSFQAWRPPQGAQPQSSASLAASTSYGAFWNGLRSVGAVTLGLRMPSREDQNGSGTTIAQRRAQKRRQDEFIDEKEGEQRFMRVRTRRGQPSFEVSLPQVEPTHEPPLADPRATFRRVRSSEVYGIGSTFGAQHPPEAPPTPIGMPGDWPGGTRGSYVDGDEDIALLLPPPLLDDRGSDARSFEGLLGVRRAREQEEARKRLQRLAARNRPAHKVGLVTALSNFVRAAHAADQATKALAISKRRARLGADRPTGLSRRHTEPIDPLRGFNQQEHPESTLSRNHQTTANADKAEMRRHRLSSPRTSIDSMSQPLQTVPEDLDLNGRESSAASSTGANSGPPLAGSRRPISRLQEGLPQPPRILPVQLFDPTTPFTPLASVHGNVTHDTDDYISARPHLSAITGSALPAAPRIGPTMLSLPPSPWTPHAGADDILSPSSVHFQTFSLALAEQDASLPHTPRLVPTHLSVMPSPLASRTNSPPSLKHPAHRGSLFTSLSSHAGSPHPQEIARALAGVSSSLLNGSRNETVGDGDDSRAQSVCKSPVIGPGEASKDTSLPAQRSFFLWWLFGDLLQYRFQVAAASSESTQARWWLLVAAHIFGFAHFCLLHLIDLAYELTDTFALAFWFIKWIMLNVTGQTILSRCVLEAYALIQAEWSLVAQEDHEDKVGLPSEGSSVEASRGPDGRHQRRGLTRIQVLRGFIELICLHAVTRSRWVDEGSGLKPLQGWRKEHQPRRRADDTSKHYSTRTDESEAESTAEEDEDEDEVDLVVTRREADILEFVRTPRIRPRTSTGEQSEGNSGYFGAAAAGGMDGHSRRSSLGAGRSTSPHHPASPSQRRSNRLLVRTLKWASRLAVGAYGLHVHIVDLPPTFTPSGERFNRQTFAHLSRLSNPEDVLHADIQQLAGDSHSGEDGAPAPYQPTFYVARDHVRKTIVVAVRGTQSFSDVIADLDMRTEQFPLPSIQPQQAQRNGAPESASSGTGIPEVDDLEENELTCHAGVLRAAQSLIMPGSTLISTLTSALDEHQDFGLAFVGHSLGAAIASAVVMLLATYRPETPLAAGVMSSNGDTTESSGVGSWYIGANTAGLPEGRSIRAISFAPPATFSAALSRRAAFGSTPLVLSVVLGADIIPRAGHGQARELRRVLGALARVRRRHESRAKASHVDADIDSGSGTEEEDARVHIFRSWWKWSKLVAKDAHSTASSASRSYTYADDKRKGLTSEELLAKRRIESQLWKLRCDVEADLYSAIKARSDNAQMSPGSEEVVQMGRGRSAVPPSPWVGPRERAQAPLHKLAERRQALDAVTLQSEAKLGGVLIPAGKVIYIDDGESSAAEDTASSRRSSSGIATSGPKTQRYRLYDVESPLSFFSLPEFTSTLFASHLPSSYEAAIEDL
ncbi:unnamed protein product [Parajaminaea phylloscopi]